MSAITFALVWLILTKVPMVAASRRDQQDLLETDTEEVMPQENPSTVLYDFESGTADALFNVMSQSGFSTEQIFRLSLSHGYTGCKGALWMQRPGETISSVLRNLFDILSCEDIQMPDTSGGKMNVCMVIVYKGRPAHNEKVLGTSLRNNTLVTCRPAGLITTDKGRALASNTWRAVDQATIFPKLSAIEKTLESGFIVHGPMWDRVTKDLWPHIQPYLDNSRNHVTFSGLSLGGSTASLLFLKYFLDIWSVNATNSKPDACPATGIFVSPFPIIKYSNPDSAAQFYDFMRACSITLIGASLGSREVEVDPLARLYSTQPGFSCVGRGLVFDITVTKPHVSLDCISREVSGAEPDYGSKEQALSIDIGGIKEADVMLVAGEVARKLSMGWTDPSSGVLMISSVMAYHCGRVCDAAFHRMDGELEARAQRAMVPKVTQHFNRWDCEAADNSWFWEDLVAIRLPFAGPPPYPAYPRRPKVTRTLYVPGCDKSLPSRSFLLSTPDELWSGLKVPRLAGATLTTRLEPVDAPPDALYALFGFSYYKSVKARWKLHSKCGCVNGHTLFKFQWKKTTHTSVRDLREDDFHDDVIDEGTEEFHDDVIDVGTEAVHDDVIDEGTDSP